MMTAPRRGVAFRARSALDGGADFDRIAQWATDHLVQLVREVHPGWGKGRGEVRGPCFLHGGTHDNLAVRDGKGWTCHSGCNAGGDGVDLWRRMHFNGADTKAGRLAALRDLAPRAGVHLDTRHPVPRRAAPAPSTDPTGERGRPVAPPDPLAAELAALRALGIVPALPATVYAAVLDALPRTDAGDAVLTARGFDPADAFAYGFRHVDGRAGWDALADALAESFHAAELMAAGFRTKGDDDTPPRLRLAPFGPTTPALVLPYAYRGDVVALRFRASGDEVPKGGRYRSLTGAGPRVPFNADALHAAAGGVLHVTEGDLNAYALTRHGVHAVGLPGAGTRWRDAWTAALREVRHLVAWYDADDAGATGRTKLADTLRDALGMDWLRAHATVRPLPPARDANDLHRAGLLARYLEGLPA